MSSGSGNNSGNNSGRNSGNNSGNNSRPPSTNAGGRPLTGAEPTAELRAKIARERANIAAKGGGGKKNPQTNAVAPSNRPTNQGAGGGGANRSQQPNYVAEASNQASYHEQPRGGGANRSHQPTTAGESSNPASNLGYIGASGGGANRSQQPNSAAEASNVGAWGGGQNPVQLPPLQPGSSPRLSNDNRGRGPQRSPRAGPSNYTGDQPGSLEGNPGGTASHFDDDGDVRFQFGSVHAAGFPPHQPAAGQLDELRNFIRTRLRQFFRPGRENDPSYEAAIVRDLSAYLEHPEGIDSLLPAKPWQAPPPPTQNSSNAQANGNREVTKVYANSYGLTMEAKNTFYLYKIRWLDFETVPSDVKEANWKSVVKAQFRHIRPPPFFDGLQSIVLSKMELMPSEDMDYAIDGDPHNRVRLNLNAAVNADDLHNYLVVDRDQRNVRSPEDMIKFANSIMKGYCKEMKFIESERQFFLTSQHENEETQKQNVDPWAGHSQYLQRRQGFFQSVRVLECGLAMNVDFTSAAFWRPLHQLKQVWAEVVNNLLPAEDKRLFKRHSGFAFNTNPNSGEYRQQVRVANNYMRNLKVLSTHRDRIDQQPARDQRRSFNIYKVEDTNAQRQKVILNRNIGTARAGGQISLIELLCHRDGYQMPQDELEQLYPALKVSKKKDHYIPWGCCFTGDESRVTGQLDGKLLALLKMEITERHENILNFRSPRIPTSITLPTRQEVYTQISVKEELLEVKPITLGSKANYLRPHGKFIQPARVAHWAILSFNSIEWERAEAEYLSRLKEKGKTLGMFWNDYAAGWEFCQDRENESATQKRTRLKETVQRLIETHCQGRPLDLIICFMAKRLAPEYGTVKFLLDIVYGIPSQVILVSSERDLKPSALKIFTQLLKINVKCRGQNFGISSSLPRMEAAVGLRGSTILMGADVFHPKTDDDTYSIAAVTATTDNHKINYASRLKAMDRNTEIMKEILSGMVKELLQVYLSNVGSYPTNIIFFRDGLSDSQYLDCLRVEGTAILQAVKEIQSEGQHGANFNPNVAIILAIKRHHTRFFVLKRGKVENLWEGSVVSKTVTNLKDYDFFLASQKSPAVGTIRPTHYLVLLDQIKMLPGDGQGGLYHYVFNLCQTFQRCPNSVSLVAPVSYAHLAAARAKLYMQDYKLEYTGQAFPKRDDPRLALDPHVNLKNRLWYL